eukprot:SAG31_NODE_512_length_14721_cov_17.995623_13_plen_103_part_00
MSSWLVVVDRGACSLETVLVLLSLKVRYPSRVTLVRGNHEDRNINMQYGFREECRERCGSEGNMIWEEINKVFVRQTPYDVSSSSIYCRRCNLQPRLAVISS